MSLTVTDLAEEVRESNRRLTEAIQELRVEFHALRGDIIEIKTSLKLAKWIGAILVGAALTGLWHSYQAVRLVTRIESDVVALRRDFARIEGAVGTLQQDNVETKSNLAGLKSDVASLKSNTAEMGADIKNQAGQSAKVLESLDRIEKRLAQTRPANLE